jgi:hypothetical protein
MDLLLKEHQRLWKRAQSSKSIDDVQATIDLLKEARNTIAKSESLTGPSTLKQSIRWSMLGSQRSSVKKQ